MAGRLKPNARIRETDIAQTLQMSRTPIREALRDLEAEGVVVSYPSLGTFVAALSPYDVEEIFELRSFLEVWALEKGINRITDQDLDQAREMFEDANKSGEWSDIHAADLYLHNMIVEKSGSKRLAIFMSNLNTQIERISMSSATDPKREEQTLKEHIEIINCIRSRDLKKSQEVLREHLKNVAEAAIEEAKII